MNVNAEVLKAWRTICREKLYPNDTLVKWCIKEAIDIIRDFESPESIIEFMETGNYTKDIFTSKSPYSKEYIGQIIAQLLEEYFSRQGFMALIPGKPDKVPVDHMVRHGDTHVTYISVSVSRP